MKLREDWGVQGRDFWEGKIKPVGTGRIFRVENSTKRAPPTSYPVLTRDSERDELTANFSHTLNSDHEVQCVTP